MRDLPDSNKTYRAGTIVVGAVLVNVLLLTGSPKILFGCATYRVLGANWRRGGLDGTGLRYAQGRFVKNPLKTDKRLLIE